MGISQNAIDALFTIPGHAEKCSAPVARKGATRPDFVGILLQGLLREAKLVPESHVMVVEMWGTLRRTAQKQLGWRTGRCSPWELRKPWWDRVACRVCFWSIKLALLCYLIQVLRVDLCIIIKIQKTINTRIPNIKRYIYSSYGQWPDRKYKRDTPKIAL